MVVAIIIAACGAPPIQHATPPAGAPSPVPSPTPTAIASLDVDRLPRIELDPHVLTAVCDTDPGIETTDDAESALACGTAVELAVRSVVAVAGGPAERVYVQRPTCAATLCTQHEVDAAIAWVWIPGRVLGVDVSADLGYLPVPVAGMNAPWPATTVPVSPAADASPIDDAPPVIAARDPYPSCGHAEDGQTASVGRCFRDLVLAGRPVEMTETLFGTEGGEVLRLYRFAGAGAIRMYQRFEGDWMTQPGSMIIGPGLDTWSFEPWDVPEASTRL